MMKKKLRYVLSILMAFTLLAGLAVSAGATEEVVVPPVLEGEGTKESPFLIGTAEELLCYFDYEDSLNGSYEEGPVVTYAELTADLVFEGEYNNYNNFNHFYGVLDGKGYTISGIDSIYTPFVHRNEGTLKNLIFADCTFRGTDEVCGLVDDNRGLIEYCVMTPTVTLEIYEDDGPIAPGYYRPPLHGVIACSNYGTIRYCVSLATSELDVSGICPNSFENGEVYECVTSLGSVESDKTVVFVEDEDGYPLGFEYAANENMIAENCAALGSRTYTGLEAPVSEEELFSADFAARMTAETGVEWAVSDYGVVPASVIDLLNEEKWKVDEVNPVEYHPLFEIDLGQVNKVSAGTIKAGMLYDITGSEMAEQILSVINDFQYTHSAPDTQSEWDYRIVIADGAREYDITFGETYLILDGTYYYSAYSDALAEMKNAAFMVGFWAEDLIVDVPFNTWYSRAVYRCAQFRIINGYEDGTFRPNAQLTRAEAVKMIVEAFDVDGADRSSVALTDVLGHWAYHYIDEAVTAGIVGGYPDGTFRPDAPITRAELVKLIVAAADLTIDPDSPLPDALVFYDCESHWAYDALETAYYNGIVEGYEDGSFKPDNNITRAEAAKMIYGAYSMK